MHQDGGRNHDVVVGAALFENVAPTIAALQRVISTRRYSQRRTGSDVVENTIPAVLRLLRHAWCLDLEAESIWDDGCLFDNDRGEYWEQLLEDACCDSDTTVPFPPVGQHARRKVT